MLDVAEATEDKDWKESQSRCVYSHFVVSVFAYSFVLQLRP